MRNLFILAFLFFGLLFAGAVAAQTIQEQGSQANQPIDINADKLAVDQKTGDATFSGNVKVVQGVTTLTSEAVTAHYTGQAAKPAANSGNSGIESIIATGSLVKVVRNNNGVLEVATGTRAVYKPGSQVLTMTGTGASGVTLTRLGNTLRGQLLTYNLASGQVTLSGGGGISGHFQSGGAVGALPQIKSAPDAASQGRLGKSFALKGQADADSPTTFNK